MIILKTLNSAVRGRFTARRQFAVKTTNAPVDLVVTAMDKGDGRPTEIVMSTTNAYVSQATQDVSCLTKKCIALFN